jgi:aryl-alcohol dehydrogenase-like predicted oxidoreductase
MPENQAMPYRNLPGAGIKVSQLCLGTMMFGGPSDEAESLRIIDHALETGINFLDTANVYNGGASEQIVGKAIAGRRDRVVVATKGRQPMGEGPNDQGSSRLHILRAAEESLRRLATDYIDLYYLHTPDETTPIEESLRALDDLVRQGKVRYIGCSNFRAWRVCEALWTSDRRNLERFVCVQPLYNIVNRDAEVELLPLCREHKIAVVPYSPLARGVLTGKYQPGEAPPEGSRAARGDRRIRQTELREESFEVAQSLNPCAAGLTPTVPRSASSPWPGAWPIRSSRR